MPLAALMQQLSKSQKILVLPEGEDERIWQASKILLEKKTVKEIWILGREDSFRSFKKKYELESENQIKYAPAMIPNIAEQTKIELVQRNAAKGKSIPSERLDELSQDAIYQAAWLVGAGHCHAGVAGAVASTAHVIRAGLSLIGLEQGLKTVSSSFAMVRRGASPRLWLYTDCGVVIDPTAEQLVDIASASLETWKALTQTPPVVAFLSFSTKGSASSESQQKMELAARIFKEKFPSIISDGEIQFDAAIDLEIGTRKAPQSELPGKTNIFVFPNLDAGNIAYKITQRLGGFEAWGPLLQGFALPWSDLSRGANPDDIVASAIINLSKSPKQQ